MLQMISGVNKLGQQVSFLAEITGSRILRQDEVFKYFISQLGEECNTLTNLQVKEGKFLYNWKKKKGRLQTASVTYRWSPSQKKVVQVF